MLPWELGDTVVRVTDRERRDLGFIKGFHNAEGLYRVRFRSDDPDDPPFDWYAPDELVLVREYRQRLRKPS